MVRPVSLQGFQKGFQGVSLRGFRGFQIFLWELCVCIKYLGLGEKTLSTLIQTNDTYESTQIDAFFESKPKIDAFLKIDANAQKVGIQNGILTPDVLETGCRFYVCGIFLVCFLYCVLRTSEKRAVSSFPLSCMPRLIHSSIHP